MKVAKLLNKTYEDANGVPTLEFYPDRSITELFELTKQMKGHDGEDSLIRTNPYSGESLALSPKLCFLHDAMWDAMIIEGDGGPVVQDLQQQFNELNHHAFMVLMD